MKKMKEVFSDNCLSPSLPPTNRFSVALDDEPGSEDLSDFHFYNEKLEESEEEVLYRFKIYVAPNVCREFTLVKRPKKHLSSH